MTATLRIHLLVLLSFVVWALLAVAGDSSQNSVGPPQSWWLSPHIDGDHPVYAWDVTPDELQRLNYLFGRDFTESGFVGQYVTHPPAQCKVCGKETEFIDWAYTAIHHGFHTREFVFESLKARKSPMERKHDVFCSQCGALTMFRRRPETEPEFPSVDKRYIHIENRTEISITDIMNERRARSSLELFQDGTLVDSKHLADEL